MNKTELIAAVAEKTDLSKKDADAAVSAVLGAITDALKAGEDSARWLRYLRGSQPCS